MSTRYYSNGKLLISGEYLILDKAISLALPTKYGQSLEVEISDKNTLEWTSFNVEKEAWFKVVFEINELEIQETSDQKIALTLKEILKTAKLLNSSFLNKREGFKVKTSLSFPNAWGLGTSSTLINNIASWAKVNPFELLEKSFGGSGYDIACASNNHPIAFQRNGIQPRIEAVNFNPEFKDCLHFVYLNIKQDSKEGINMYRNLTIDKSPFYDKINQLTEKMILAKDLKVFESLITEHESMIGDIINIEPIKQRMFGDFKGAVKSLGAWGGDFVMVTGEVEEVTNYFKAKGFETILTYDEMILT